MGERGGVANIERRATHKKTCTHLYVFFIDKFDLYIFLNNICLTAVFIFKFMTSDFYTMNSKKSPRSSADYEGID